MNWKYWLIFIPFAIVSVLLVGIVVVIIASTIAMVVIEFILKLFL